MNYWLCSFSNLDRSRFVRQAQSSLAKKRADLSGRSGRGHLVLVCAQRRRPCPLLTVNKLCRCPATQIGVAKSDFSQMCRSRSDLIKNVEHFAWIDLDLKKNATSITTTVLSLVLFSSLLYSIML